VAGRRRQLFLAIGAAVLVTSVVLVLVAARLRRSRVEVFVDNMGDVEQDIWVDGVRGKTLPPNRANEPPPSFVTTRGPHVLGVSKGAAPAPTSTVEVTLEPGGVWLYNPGNTSCYWGWVRYPDGVVGSILADEGPQPVEEVHHFKAVDFWFAPLPEARSSKLQVSMQRNAACAHLAERGCSETLRKKLIACQSAATTPAAESACRDEAYDACAFEGRRHPGAH
jgi:hypothetical protein